MLSCVVCLSIVVAGFGPGHPDRLRPGDANGKKSVDGGCGLRIEITPTAVRIVHDKGPDCTCGIEHGIETVSFTTKPGLASLPGRARQPVEAGITIPRPPRTRAIEYVTDDGRDIRYRQTLIEGVWQPRLSYEVRQSVWRDRLQSGESRDQAAEWLYGPGYRLRGSTGGLRGAGSLVPRPADDAKPQSEDRST